MRNLEEKLNTSADLIAKKDFAAAQILLENIIAHQPKNVEALKNLGLCYVNLGEFTLAANVFL